MGHNPSPRAGRPVTISPLLPTNKLIALFLDLSGMRQSKAQVQPTQTQPTCDHRHTKIPSVYGFSSCHINTPALENRSVLLNNNI